MQKENVFNIVVKGTELLKFLGIDFSLGNVGIEIEKDKLSVTAFGAQIDVSAGKIFDTDTQGYIDIVKYAQSIASLIENNYISAGVIYDGKFVIEGKILVALSPLSVSATIRIGYGKIDKTVQAYYTADGNLAGYVYLTVDGAKVKADLKGAVAVIMGMFAAEEGEKEEAQSVVEKLLSLNFEKVITLAEEGGTLSLTLVFDEIMKAFGVTFSLGSAEIKIKESGIAASVLGASITIDSCEGFEVNEEGYFDFADITPVIAKIAEIVKNKSLRFAGHIMLNVAETELALEISEGIISWKNGFELYLSACLGVGGTSHDIIIYANTDGVKFAYGGVGIQIAFGEFDSIENAFVTLYNRIRGIVGDVLAEGNENPLTAIESLSDLLSYLKGGEVVTLALGQILNGGFDWTELVQSLVITSSKLESGIVSLSYGDITIDLADQSGTDGVQAVIGYAGEALTVTGAELNMSAYAGVIPSMPEADYLGAEDFENLLDYVGAAVALITEENLNIKLEGSVISSDAIYAGAGGVKYTISAGINYYLGGGMPFSIDVNGKNVLINTDLYLKLNLTLKASLDADKSVYLDLTVIDADMEGNKDGILDFYVSASTVGEGKEGYDPLLIYAPSGEVMRCCRARL